MAVLAQLTARRWWLLLMVLFATGCRFGADQWGPFHGRMVDADTGAPIAGAHFMVSWDRDRPNPVHWTQEFYDAQETVTDADGRFEIPRQPRFFTVLVGEPRFSAFAPGYAADTEQVVTRGGQLYVDDTILKMRRLTTREEQCRRLPGGPSAEAGARAIQFDRAVRAYRLEMSC